MEREQAVAIAERWHSRLTKSRADELLRAAGFVDTTPHAIAETYARHLARVMRSAHYDDCASFNVDSCELCGSHRDECDCSFASDFEAFCALAGVLI